MLEGKRIVLGVSGGIAAYKAVELCRRLVDAGAHVVPVLTEGSLHFVGRTTFDALGSERAWTSLWDEPHPIPHTHLGQTADLVRGGAGHRPGARASTPAASATTCSPTSCSPPARRCSCARPCTPRCGSTRPCRTTCACCARAASTSWSPRPAAWPAATSAPGRLAEPDDDRRGRRRAAHRRARARPHRPARRRHRRRHPRADRPGALHRQPLVGQAGPRRRRGGRQPRRQGHPRHHHRPARPRPASTSCGSTPPPRWSTPCSAGPTRPTSS